MARVQKPLKNTKRHVVKLAEIAFRELSLPGSLHTRADEERLWRIWRGMQFLDDDQSNVRATIDDLLEDFAKTKSTRALVEGLKKLVATPPGKVEPR